MTNAKLIDRWRELMKEGKLRHAETWFEPEPGADENGIAAAERSLGRLLPPLLADLLRCSSAWGWRDADYDVQFLGPDDIVRDTLEPDEEMDRIVVGTSRDNRVKACFYSADRLTFAYSDYLRFQIDNDPAPGGVKGQIVVTDHDEEAIDWVAGSLQEFVERGLDRLARLLSGEDPEDHEDEDDDEEDGDEAPSASATARPERTTAGARKVMRVSAALDPDETLADVVEQYRSWLKEHAPQIAVQLRKGLGKSRIEATLRKWENDQEWTFPFPESHFPLFESFDGQKSTRTALLPSPVDTSSGLTLGSLDNMNSWRNNEAGLVYLFKSLAFYASVDIDDSVRRDFWNDRWFPFATGEQLTKDENLSFLLFIDMAPGASGTVGQVVLQLTNTENFSTLRLHRQVIAQSLAAYFKGIVTALRNGAVVYDAKVGLRHAQL